MEIKFNEEANCVEIVFENTEQNLMFDLTEEVKLTDFVKIISDSENIIPLIPESFDHFMIGKEPSNKEAFKLIEYLYKIVESFNESYQATYGSENMKSESKSA